MSANATTTIARGDGESTTTNATELELPLEELLEQHAARPACKAPNCFSTDRIGYVEGDDGEDIPICGDCRDIYGVGQ